MMVLNARRVRVARRLGSGSVIVIAPMRLYFAVVLTVPMTMTMTLFVSAPLFALLGEQYLNHHHPSAHLEHTHQTFHEPRDIVHMMHHHRHHSDIPPGSGRGDLSLRLELRRTGLRGLALELGGGRWGESVQRVGHVCAVLWEVLGQGGKERRRDVDGVDGGEEIGEMGCNGPSAWRVSGTDTKRTQMCLVLALRPGVETNGRHHRGAWPHSPAPTSNPCNSLRSSTPARLNAHSTVSADLTAISRLARTSAHWTPA